MQITLQIPDELSRLVPAHESLPRDLPEAYAADAYRNERLTRHQVRQVLGLDRWQAEEFLARHNAQRPLTLADREFEGSSRPSR